MPIQTAPYVEVEPQWPRSGKVILAQYDDESIVVYQAYKPSIGRFAAEHGYFGGDFSYSRMTWIKTNFLWMMFRSNWGRSIGQEVTLAIRLRRFAFEELLKAAVHSTYNPSIYETPEKWQDAVKQSDVRLQWDPDHDPLGQKVERRAIQLGLRGEAIERFGKEWILQIEDISGFVSEQRDNISVEHRDRLLVPVERAYSVDDEAVAAKLGLKLAL